MRKIRGKITILSAAHVVSCLEPAISIIIRPKEDSFRLFKLTKLARGGLFLRKAF